MALLVLAYPEVTKTDYDFIQSIRAKEDELYYSVVEPHFTVVFPLNGMKAEDLGEHVRRVNSRLSEFKFVLRCAVIDKDAFNEYTHVFLVPDEGYSDIIRLHELLYSDVLERELRLDLPFIPHIGVANSKDAFHCKRLAESLNKARFEIPGRIRELTIVEYEQGKVTQLERVLFASRPGQMCP